MGLINFAYCSSYYFSIALTPFVIYFLIFRSGSKSPYSNRDIFYGVKYIFAKKAINSYRKKWLRKINQLQLKSENELVFPTDRHSQWQYIEGIDSQGNNLILKFVLRPYKTAEACLFLRLANGNVYTLPETENVRITAIPEEKWKINGLSIEVLEPLVRLRILFNGILENISPNIEKRTEHVRFNFIFNACRSPKFFPEDIDTSILADSVSSQKWEDASWKDYLCEQYGYDQFGALRGFIKGEAYEDDLTLHLASVRSRYDGIDERYTLQRQVRIFIADSDSVLIHLVLKSFRNGFSQLNYGSVYYNNRKINSIDGADIRLQNLAPYKNIPDIFIVHIKVKHNTYKAVFHLNTTKTLKAVNNEEKGYEIYEVPAEVDLGNHQAHANVEFWYSKKGDATTRQRPSVTVHPKKVDQVSDTTILKINDEESKIDALTGGKGSSLAWLSSLDSPTNFQVPQGFILTVNAFRRQIENNPSLQRSIETLDAICCGRSTGNLEDATKQTVELFKTTPIYSEIKREVLEFKSSEETSNSTGFAVRSSAIGEDSEDLSAAGQNETFLGLKTDDEILKGIASCWASLFSYQSVQYRRQHGIPVATEIAVVVQKMVPAECAGVLFTWHPTTLNPSQMVLTANFGLGESVVSGQSEPDTIILSKSLQDDISILEQIKGSKQDVVKLTESGVVTETCLNNDKLCLTEEQAITVGKIGAFLEKSFGGPRDIEWAFYKGDLYLLQSRPITALSSWSEFELTHEFDTPILFTSDVHTRGNVGEVLPKPVSALGVYASLYSTDKGLQMAAQEQYDEHVCKGITLSHFYLLLDMAGSIYSASPKKLDISSKILDLAVFGHIVMNDRIHQSALARNGGGIGSIARLSRLVLQSCWFVKNHRTMMNAIRARENFKVDIKEEHSAQEAYDLISKSITETASIGALHCRTSANSVFSQFLTLIILLEGAEDLTTEHYADFATILSSCEDVISAEVPAALETMATAVNQSGVAAEFCAIKPEEGTKFLRDKCPVAFELFEEFLENHGHRTICEFEMMADSWEMDPSRVVVMLQANVKHGKSITKVHASVEEVVNSLTTPKRNLTRYIVKVLLPRVRKAVSIRETTKSEWVKIINVLKKAYKKLAKKITYQGILPSEDLIYHFSHYELGQLIDSRNPLLIIKAKKRQQLYKKLENLSFPEVIYGLPEPIKEDEVPDVLTFVCKGTPVCSGEVKARACVVTSLDEIHQLQSGDILITHSTDIGWSPYFPLVSGVVTELGGLISHGAVVAREYGLPCLVAVANATKVFKTGDQVFLNAKTGELGKI